MSEVIKSYDDTCGRACEVRYDTARGARPYWVETRGAVKLCATYRAQEEAEHAAAHFMATGNLPKEKNAQKAREGADGADGAEVCAGEGKPCGRPAANARNGQL